MSPQSEVLCLDVQGLTNGNDGPFTDEATYYGRPAGRPPGPGSRPVRGSPAAPLRTQPASRPAPFALAPTDADIVWLYDCKKELKVWPHDAASSAVLVYGDYCYVGTSDNIGGVKGRKPNSTVPNFIVLDKRTGQLVARDNAPIARRKYHGQWSSPSLGVVNGRTLVFYGGGDGICYAFDAEIPPGEGVRTLKTVWSCDANPPEYLMRDGKELAYIANHEGPSEIIATPTFHRNRVYVTIGQDQLHGPGKGCLTCIDATKAGDISPTGIIWRYKDINRSMCTPTVADGLVYAGDRTGVFHCVDAETGTAVWTHRVGGGAIWSSALVADGKVYVGSESGRLWVFASGRQKRILNSISLRFPVHASPMVANGVLYVASSRHLFALQAPR